MPSSFVFNDEESVLPVLTYDPSGAFFSVGC